jgi:GGDEF domain-containing protein
MKWDEFKEFLGDALLIAFGAVLAFQFITIQIMGRYGQEPNQVILVTEIIASLMITLIGIERFIKDVNNRRPKG